MWDQIDTGEFLPSPYMLLFLLPAGLWTGGAYSHFTRFQSGKLSRTKRILLGSLAGFSVTFVFLSLIFMVLTVSFSGSGSISDWPTLLIISAILGGISGILSVFGALTYIFGIQKWMTKSAAQKQSCINR
jgi:hypothetical protein